MKKKSFLFFLIFLTIVFFYYWLDNEWKNSMKNDYYDLVLKETFTNERVYLIERYKSNNKIYGFYLGMGSKYYCFQYENGFDEFVDNGDKLSKKSGELKLKVTKKSNEEKTFTFEIKDCDVSSSDIFPLIYTEGN